MCLCLFFVAGISPQAMPTERLEGIRIRNFSRVDDHYYRGGQPRGADYADLASLGIKAVVDLKHADDVNESDLVRQMGMRFYLIPLTTISAPSGAAVTQFLKLVDDPENQPVFVHCEGGHDRTGVMTAIYRVTHDGWTSQQAYAEMKRFGFDGALTTLKEFFFDYARHSATRTTGPAPGGGSG